MRTRWTISALAVAAISFSAVPAFASPTGAETSLVGVKLFDSAMKLIAMFGSPDELQAVSIGGGGGGGGSGFGGASGRGMPGGMSGMSGGMGMRAPTGGGMGASGKAGGAGFQDTNDPFQFGTDVLRQIPASAMRGGTIPGTVGGGSGVPGGMGMRGMPGMSSAPNMPSGMPGMSGASMPGMSGGSNGSRVGAGVTGPGERTTFTRWVYNRSSSKYGFIVDKAGRVVQIEAVGLSNPRVKTKRGIGFGSTFATLITRYGNPEGYDIAGDNFSMRYLADKHVVFRLSRLGDKKPHQVTGIVIAAGK